MEILPAGKWIPKSFNSGSTKFSEMIKGITVRKTKLMKVNICVFPMLVRIDETVVRD